MEKSLILYNTRPLATDLFRPHAERSQHRRTDVEALYVISLICTTRQVSSSSDTKDLYK